jgi:hypothetical protein
MADFGIFRGFGDKLFQGQMPTQLGLIGSQDFNPLLLDAYPNAAAAYSVRKLRTLYTGSAIRVRRSSDNTETDIGFSGANLDTSALTSFCGSGNGFVTTWYDQSGNANNASQTNALLQPQIVSSGSVLTINSKPSIKFDGSNDRLTNISGAITTTSSSIFSVIQPSVLNSAADNVIVSQYNTSTGRFIFSFNLITGNFRLRIFEGSGMGNIYGTTNISNNTTYLTEMINNNKSVTGYLNGGSQMSGTFSTQPPNVSNNIAAYDGTGGFLNGYESEVIIYNSNQSSNRTGIESNINTYYGIY